MPWLRDYVWPAEARLTEEIVYAGARLAILELIRSGTVFANDMYWHAPMVARAAEEMGIRCAVSMQTVETGGPGVDDPRNVAANAALADLPREASSRVFTTLAPHAVYTVCEATLRRLADRDAGGGGALPGGTWGPHARPLSARLRPPWPEDADGARRPPDG